MNWLGRLGTLFWTATAAGWLVCAYIYRNADMVAVSLGSITTAVIWHRVFVQ